jgi:uncharacterized Ntn-hydrolase superfamily protein
MTFSIVARCPRTGQLGVAVATAVPAVGSMCPYIESGVGAVSTQSWVNPYLAIEALRLMAAGHSGPDALAMVLARDPEKNLRQIGLVDSKGRGASWSGPRCTEWFGHIVEADFAVQGNMLANAETIRAMADAFKESAALELAERLMLALEVGDEAGGDKRGRQSAALRVHDTEAYPLLDLRVDEHARPIEELRRVYTIAKLQLLPFVRGMPRKGTAAGAVPDDVASMLLKPPPERPGGGGSAP